MELENRDSLMSMFNETDRYETESGVKVLERRKFDHLAGRNNVARITLFTYDSGVGPDFPSLRRAL